MRQEGEEFNRIDKGACLALKAIVRWIAAQPLYNGGLRDADGNPTGISPLGDADTRVGAQEYKEYKQERWQNALKAAEEFMEVVDMGRYKLYKSTMKLSLWLILEIKYTNVWKKCSEIICSIITKLF